MEKFGKEKIALFLACAQVLGGKTSAKDIDKVRTQTPQTVAAVGGAAVSNSGYLKRFNNMSGLTKGLIAAGAVLGTIELVNEGLGIFTDADAWYKGKFSIANGIKYLVNKKMKPEIKHEEKGVLVNKILDVINSFEGEDSIKSKIKLEGGEGKKSKVIEYRKSKGDFDRVAIEEFNEKGKAKSEELCKRLILNELLDSSEVEYLNNIKRGDNQKPYDGTVSYEDNSIKFTSKDSSYYIFKIMPNGTLSVDYHFSNDFNFKCVLSVPSK